MIKLEDLQPNTVIRGILPDCLVSVVSVQWFGSEALELTYKDPTGRVANQLLYRHDQPRLEVVEQGRPWSFDGDGALFRLVSEAHRIRLAHLFDPVLAVHTSLVDPLPHQITAVYESMLPRQPLVNPPPSLATRFGGSPQRPPISTKTVRATRCRDPTTTCQTISTRDWWSWAPTPYSKEPNCPAEVATKKILDSRGSSPRLYRNTLAFLAVDKTRLQDLDEAVRRYLAWDSIVSEKENLDLSPHQVKQAETQKAAADTVVSARIPEAYQWLLVPSQSTPQTPVELQPIRLSGQDALAVRASKKLRNDELLVTSFAASRLRIELDRVPLWRGDHVAIKQLVEDFARYLYLPRLKEPAVLIEAIRNGLALLTWERDSFGFADSYDEAAGRYRGLRFARQASIPDQDAPGLLVKPDVVRKHIEAEQTRAQPTEAARAASGPTGPGGDACTSTTSQKPAPSPQAKRYRSPPTNDVFFKLARGEWLWEWLPFERRGSHRAGLFFSDARRDPDPVDHAADAKDTKIESENGRGDRI